MPACSLPTPAPPSPGGGYWTLKASGGLCVEVAGASTAAGASLVLATCRATGNSSQQFSAVALGAPFPASAVSLRPRHAPGMCISVAGGSTSDSARLVLGACSSGTSATSSIAAQAFLVQRETA